MTEIIKYDMGFIALNENRFMKNGSHHLKYYKNGIKYYEEWRDRGDRYHREDGPARRWMKDDHFDLEEHFYLHGIKCTKMEYERGRRFG